jgi:hypothetical protein
LELNRSEKREGAGFIVGKAEKKAERIVLQISAASREALNELLGIWANAAMSSAELWREECSISKSAKKWKQRALRSVASWTAGAGGTRSSMAFAERPRTRLVKAVVDDVGADMVVA